MIDLYQDHFDPVLHFDRKHRRRNLIYDPEIQKYCELIKWSEKIIFIFPIWWSGMPAILKGFIDRVFVKNFAYYYQGLFPIGLLKGRTAWIVNTNDTPMIYVKLFQQDYGNVLKKQCLKMCGIKSIKHTSLYYMRGISQQKRKRFLKRIAKIAECFR